MLRDSIGRRNRTTRQPVGTRVKLKPRDLAVFEFIHRHGGRLPTSYLFDYTQELGKDYNSLQHRLCTLFHEGFLDRDWRQNETLDPRNNDLVHELSDLSLELLQERGLFSEYAPSPHGAFKHQVMLSCVSASFELNTKGTDITYVPQADILTRVGHDHKMQVGGDYVTPDEVFALNSGGKEILIFLEADRGTEVTASQNFNRKSWTRSIRQYKQIIGGGMYKDAFNATNGALLLIITVSKAKQDGILKVIAEEYPQGCNYILVHHIPEFGRMFHPPKQLSLLTADWQRCGHPAWRFVK